MGGVRRGWGSEEGVGSVKRGGTNLSSPYFSLRPNVQRKTPPKAMSSPKITEWKRKKRLEKLNRLKKTN